MITSIIWLVDKDKNETKRTLVYCALMRTGEAVLAEVQDNHESDPGEQSGPEENVADEFVHEDGRSHDRPQGDLEH